MHTLRQMVDQAIARYGIEPGCKGPAAVVGSAPRMNRNQGFLHEIFHIAFAAQAAPVE